jgi:hypothetical protein
MTPAMPNLAGQEDVYSVHTSEHAPAAALEHVQLVILLERFPGALARAYALLCLFELVPIATRTELSEDDAIQLELHFGHLPPDRLDLLVRKFRQLTECLGVRVGGAGPCHANVNRVTDHKLSAPAVANA